MLLYVKCQCTNRRKTLKKSVEGHATKRKKGDATIKRPMLSTSKEKEKKRES
jgi:hypothetical protein